MRRVVAVIVPAILVAAGAMVTQAFGRASQTAGLDQAAVVAIFDLANSADIETGQLAAERAQNKEVRDFGKMLAETHTAVRQQGRDLAKKLGVTPALPKDDKMAEGHAAVMKNLGALRGEEFDRAFLAHEQAFHAAVLSAVKTSLLPAISSTELRDFVTSLAPAFESHRVMAEHLEKKLGGK